MSDMNTTIDLIRNADPIPLEDAFPGGALSSADLLARIDEMALAGDTAGLPPEATKARRVGVRGPIVALAVAAAILVVVGVVAFLLDPGGDPADQQPMAPLEVVEAFRVAYDDGDFDAVEELIAPDASFATAPWREEHRSHSWYHAVTGLTTHHRCIDSGGGRVECTVGRTSGLEPGRALPSHAMVVSIADGLITAVDLGSRWSAPSVADGLGQQRYVDWLGAEHPDEVGDLVVGGTMLAIHTPELRARQSDLIGDFRAQASQDTTLDPALAVVSAYFDGWDDADPEAYESVVDPAANLFAAGAAPAVAYSARYADATGVDVDRECQLVVAGLVRCVSVVFSGLAPGTVLLTETMSLAVDDGLITEFGFLTEFIPYTERDGDNAVAYLDWVRENEPSLVADLFDASAPSDAPRLIVDTDEIRSLHRDLVARFLTDPRNS